MVFSIVLIILGILDLVGTIALLIWMCALNPRSICACALTIFGGVFLAIGCTNLAFWTEPNGMNLSESKLIRGRTYDVIIPPQKMPDDTIQASLKLHEERKYRTFILPAGTKIPNVSKIVVDRDYQGNLELLPGSVNSSLEK